MSGKLTVEQMKSGYSETWCFSCKTSTIHEKIRVKKGKWGIEKQTLYECQKCGRRKRVLRTYR